MNIWAIVLVGCGGGSVVEDRRNMNYYEVPSLPSDVKRLHLNHNRIQRLKRNSFPNLNLLEELVLTYNNMHDIDVGAFNNLTGLRTLNLAHNHITQLGFHIFDDLIELRSIDFSNNRLSVLPSVFGHLASLNAVRAQNNPINTVNLQIFHACGEKPISMLQLPKPITFCAYDLPQYLSALNFEDESVVTYVFSRDDLIGRSDKYIIVDCTGQYTADCRQAQTDCNSPDILGPWEVVECRRKTGTSPPMAIANTRPQPNSDLFYAYICSAALMVILIYISAYCCMVRSHTKEKTLSKYADPSAIKTNMEEVYYSTPIEPYYSTPSIKN